MKGMVKEFLLGLMEEFIKENLKIINNMVKEYILTQMEIL